MGLIIPIAVILLGSIMLTVWLDKRIEETFGMYVMFISVVLYFFYLFDALICGVYVVTALSIGLFIITILRFSLTLKTERIKSKNSLTKVITPAFVVAAIVLIVGWFIVRNNIVFLSDPMRLWGAYPKALYYTDRLQIGEDSLIFDMESSYIPGMSLLVYFFEKLGYGDFSEPVIYFVYVFVLTICFLPAMSKLKWDNWGKIPLFSIIILALPLVIYNSFEYKFYFSLFIDPILGIFMGYLLFLLTRPVLEEWFLTVQFALGLIMTTLMKDSAIVFSICAAIWVVACGIKKKYRHLGLKSILILATPFLAYLSWQIMMFLHGIIKHSVPFSLKGLLDMEFIKEFIIVLCTSPLFESLYSFVPYLNSFVGGYILLLAICVLIYRLLPVGRRGVFIGGIGACIFMQIVYVGGYYALCLNGWGRRMPCLGRYMGAILLGELCFLCMFLMWREKNERICYPVPEWTKAGITLSALCAISIISFESPSETGFTFYELFEQEVEQIDLAAEDIAEELRDIGNKPAKIFVTGDDYFLLWDAQLRMYFDLIGSGVQVGNYVTDCELIGNISKEEFMKMLTQEGFEYVYLLKSSEEFIKEFGTLFYDDSVDEATLWAVDVENGMLELVRSFEKRLG